MITPAIKYALAYAVVEPRADRILPEPLDKAVVPVIARAVRHIVAKEQDETITGTK